MLESDLRELKILTIDDNRHMRMVIKSLLHAIGCVHVREAGDAALAFKEMQNFPADLIIVDWAMEPLDGLDFVRLVRTAKDSRNPYVPIIMLSGYTEYRRVSEARDAGVSEFLAKPVSAQQLSSRITSLFKHPRDFVRVKNYCGPDRRRNDFGPPRGKNERRKADRQQLGAA